MLKWIGICCMIAGCTGMGMSCARDLELRIAELTQLRQLVMLLKGELRYMRQPLPEALHRLGEKASPPFAGFLADTAKEMEERRGESAEAIWRKHLQICSVGLHLTRQEIKELERLGNVLGYLDVEMQVNALDYYLEQLRLSSEQAREAVASRKRLYQYMGVLGGIALGILIF